MTLHAFVSSLELKLSGRVYLPTYKQCLSVDVGITNLRAHT